ncbi:inter-alpha-trypsin inhibitor heavy chain H3 [Bombina bombina]|uniref:inter-alpha-trypsin inhibitor heavy chain H3 n=1 Tax=Bombina bombina TaxID=8345 RepID=UPI00235B08AB|nr:inter-alpha-trypsin inhibitor heavy chain H3 [Bombina bombina]
MGHLLLFFAFFLCLSTFVSADFLIEAIRNIQKRSTQEPGGKIEIYSVNIDSKVTSRFAHNVITSRAVNRANKSQEIFFDVDLPKTAFITNFSMTIDGVTYEGVIKEKEAAKQQYQKAVSRGQTAGLVKASGRKTEKFTVSVNVASESKVTFELVYEELLKRNLGKYEMFIKVKPKTLVNKFKIDIDIYEPQGITFLDANATFVTNDLWPVIQKSFSGNKGHISFNPTIDQQRSCPDCETTLLDGDFTVTYDVNRDSAGKLQVVNGYFVHYFAPSKLPVVPKNTIFVIDRSDSMWGQNMNQTKEALLKILQDIKEHDHFNFISFDEEIEVWKEKLMPATAQNVEEARKFVNSIFARGMTNINDPLMKAIELLNNAHELKEVPERSTSLIILLTDGQANAGESYPPRIQQNVKKAGQGKYTLYSLGFGTGVDYNFLEKLALENSGVARRIYEDSDAALQMQGFYDEVATPTLVNIQLQYPENAISDITQNNYRNYFDGSEIVVAGRITDNDLNTFTADIKAEGANDLIKYTENIDLQNKDDALKQQEYIFGDYIERLWAYLTIQQLLEKRIYADPSEKQNLTEKALELSLKYKFVTPLTSMVVTKPEEKEDELLIADKFVEGQSERYQLIDSLVQSLPLYPYVPSYPTSFVDSDPHFIIRVPKKNDSLCFNIQGKEGMVFSLVNDPTLVDSDPHFIIRVPKKNDSLCFNIQGKEGMVFSLVNDPTLGIAVNGELIGNKKTKNSSLSSNETYFGKLGIVNKEMDLYIEVNTRLITINKGNKKMSFSWLETASISEGSLNVLINKKKNMLISMGEGGTFVIILHKVWINHPLHKDFLGFYTLDNHMFSQKAHGLLGQFFHGIDYEVFNIHKTSDSAKPDASMIVKNKLLTVTRGIQKDYRKDPRNGSKVPCWFIHYNGEGLIDGNYTDYIVPSIFSIQ